MTITAKYPGRCSKCGQPIQVGETIEWEKGKGGSHVSCPAKPEPKPEDANLIRISGGSGYGCHGYSVGQVVKDMERRRRQDGEVLPGEDPAKINPYWVNVGYRYLTVVSASKRYVSEDGMSFGVGDESGYIYSAKCRLATDKEIAPLLAADREREEARAKLANLKAISEEIRKNGTYPEGNDNFAAGVTVPIGKGQDIYGGGSWFVIGEDKIWYVVNNGSDGDDWSHNNVRTGGAGAIGHYVPYSSELEARILSNGKPEEKKTAPVYKIPAPIPTAIPAEAVKITNAKTKTGIAVDFYRHEDRLLAEFVARGQKIVAVCDLWGRSKDRTTEGLLCRSKGKDLVITITKAEAESLLNPKPATKSEIMKRAWQIAREGAKRFGGNSKKYFTEALREAWAETRMAKAA